MLRYCLPEGRSWKRLWEGWVGSFTILVALLEHRARKMSRMEGRGAPMICVHCPLEGLAVCCTAVSVPDSDAAGQHALNGTPVEGGEDGWREACSFQPAVKALLYLGDRCSVGGPGEVLCDEHPQEFSAADSLHSRAVDGFEPEFQVHHNLVCLTRIEGQVVSTTPFSQLCHFLSVVRFIIAADETYH